MTRATVLPASIPSSRMRLRRSLAVLAAAAVVLGACGGGDDEDETADTTAPATLATQPPLATPPPATLATLPPATTAPAPVTYVTTGASVMVANASRIDGAAGRMSDRLADVGFETVAPGNYTLGQLEVTKVYFDAANPSARAVADSLQAGLGGGAIEVVEMPTPVPVDSGTVNGAGVLVAMGNDTADKTLGELQGITPAPTSAPAPDADTGTDTETATATAEA